VFATALSCGALQAVTNTKLDKSTARISKFGGRANGGMIVVS